MTTKFPSNRIAALVFFALILTGCGGGGGGGGDTGATSIPNTGSTPAVEAPAESVPAAVTIISGKA